MVRPASKSSWKYDVSRYIPDHFNMQSFSLHLKSPQSMVSPDKFKTVFLHPKSLQCVVLQTTLKGDSNYGPSSKALDKYAVFMYNLGLIRVWSFVLQLGPLQSMVFQAVFNSTSVYNPSRCIKSPWKVWLFLCQSVKSPSN